MNGKTISIHSESKKFTIVPSWETYAKEADEELCIELDPGMALEQEIIRLQVCV